jgi:hypothetical protein
MPFTPFHLGPALSLGLPLRKYIHAPTFIVANVAVDIEPLLVLLLRLNYPLHGYLHTFLLSFFFGLAIGFAMFHLEKFLHPLYKTLLLTPNGMSGMKAFIVAGAFGAMLHVLFDSPLYTEIQPFFPITTNPLYNSVSSSDIYSGCVWLGILGLIFYAILVLSHAYKKMRNRHSKNQSTNPT